jgi:methyltransferase (TIGR00027 family)
VAEPVIQNVSDTAFMIAAHRASESRRADALFCDPLAAKLAGERGERIVADLPRRWMTGWSVAVRTVVIDELIAGALARGADTVLNLGAGLDTRPYRMDLPADLRWIEVDYAPMIDLKEGRLASEVPRCRLERVRMDLADLPARRSLFAEVGARSKNLLVLTEGVIPYLRVEDVAALADDLRSLGSVRGWIVDYFSKDTLRYRKKSARTFQNAPIKFDPDDWFAFFAGHGWRPTEQRFLAIEGERLRRPVPFPLPMRFWMGLARHFGPPGRRERMRRFTGYFVLEPT